MAKKYVNGKKSTHEEVFQALDSVPAYREVSASGKGIHIIFRFKDFNKLINDKFIWKVTDGLEIFVSGKTNKMLIYIRPDELEPEFIDNWKLGYTSGFPDLVIYEHNQLYNGLSIEF